MRPPTLDEFNTLAATFEKFIKKRALTAGVISSFGEWLTEVKDRRTLKYLLETLKNTSLISRTLRGLNNLQFQCKICGKDICNGSGYCTEACIDQAVNRVQKDTSWRVLSKRKTSQSYILKLQCTECHNLVNKSLGAFLCGYSCKCQRDQKLSIKRTAFGRRNFYKKLEERKPNVTLHDSWVSAFTKLRYTCNSCGNEHKALPSGVLVGACPVCAPLKSVETCLELYGVSHVSMVPSIKAKIRRKMKEKLGVEHALQNKEVFEKMQRTSMRRKPYKLGRRTVMVQGYEPQALDWLLANTTLTPPLIRCGNDKEVPTLYYRFEGDTRTHYPDIFVPFLNILIEVKNTHLNSVDRKRILAKQRYARKLGYDYFLMVMDYKGNLHGKTNKWPLGLFQ